jgi:dipeptidyl aminopeptidase/acylaminoacyl peptidase
MLSRSRSRTLLCAVLALVWVGPVASQDRRPITEMDLFKFVWVGEARVSPDGTQAAYVRVTVNQKDDNYDTAIWVVPTDGSTPPRALTSGTRDSSPRWSPDGRRLAFVRAPQKEGRPQPAQIFLLDMAGGEARQLTNVPRGAGSPAWSPDGRTIAFTSNTAERDFVKKKEGERESDVRVITRATYRSNGSGYTDPSRHTHVWTVAAEWNADEPVEARRLTDGEFDEQGITWSPDGRWIYFTSNRVGEPYYEPRDSDLYAVPAGGGEIVKVADIDGAIGSIAPSPDGTRIAFVGTIEKAPVRSFSQPDLFVTGAAPGSTPRNLTAAYDLEIGGGIGGDQRAPRGGGGSQPVWSRDGRSIFVVVSEHGNANIKRIDAASGTVEPYTRGNHDVMSYTAVPGGDRLAMVISSPTQVGDLYVGAASGELTRLTSHNDELFQALSQREPEEIWYDSFDGKKIQGWILKPPDFEEGRKYPLILQIHGGPHSAYGNTFTHEFSWMAARGFVVFYTNPRGSTSYGQDFANIIQFNYPGDDYKDLMAGVDELLKRGYIDEKRMGVTGGSGGGVLTNWTIGHTQRFAAAVSQRSIADWSGFWYTADFTLFQPTWFRAAPWQDPQDFSRRSPITYVANVTTPLMLIEGEADYRTPPADGGEQMFRALKYLKKSVVMVRFPGESHELSRSGQPWHRVERLQHMVGWFEKYLQGKKTETYQASGLAPSTRLGVP